MATGLQKPWNHDWLTQKDTLRDLARCVVWAPGCIDHRGHRAGSAECFCDIPASYGIGKADIGNEKMDDLGVQKHLDCAVARRSLKHRPSFLLEAEDDVRTHKPIILYNQNS